jgi:hypothetical protein
MTRYGGTYEGGEWACIAFCRQIPEEAVGDDLEASKWWNSSKASRVGVGNTPQAAYNDMVDRHYRISPHTYLNSTTKYTICGTFDCEDGLSLNSYRVCNGSCLKKSSSNTTYYT